MSNKRYSSNFGHPLPDNNIYCNCDRVPPIGNSTASYKDRMGWRQPIVDLPIEPVMRPPKKNVADQFPWELGKGISNQPQARFCSNCGVQLVMECATCGGHGHEPCPKCHLLKRENCPSCGGTGEVYDPQVMHRSPCPTPNLDLLDLNRSRRGR